MPPLKSPQALESVADLAITICGVVFVMMLIYAENLFNVILMLAAAS